MVANNLFHIGGGAAWFQKLIQKNNEIAQLIFF